MAILVYVEHDQGKVKAATLHAVTAAAKISSDIHLLVAGVNVSSVAEEAKSIMGVAKVLVADCEGSLYYIFNSSTFLKTY